MADAVGGAGGDIGVECDGHLAVAEDASGTIFDRLSCRLMLLVYNSLFFLLNLLFFLLNKIVV